MKKKATMVMEHAIGLVFFAIIMLVVILPVGIVILKIVVAKPEGATVNSLERLVREIKYLDDRETVPLYVDNKNFIKGFSVGATKPAKCSKDKPCLCICKTEGCTGTNVQVCLDVEYSKNEKIDFANNFIVDPTEKAENFELKLENNLVSISKKI